MHPHEQLATTIHNFMQQNYKSLMITVKYHVDKKQVTIISIAILSNTFFSKACSSYNYPFLHYYSFSLIVVIPITMLFNDFLSNQIFFKNIIVFPVTFFFKFPCNCPFLTLCAITLCYFCWCYYNFACYTLFM